MLLTNAIASLLGSAFVVKLANMFKNSKLLKFSTLEKNTRLYNELIEDNFS